MQVDIDERIYLVIKSMNLQRIIDDKEATHSR